MIEIIGAAALKTLFDNLAKGMIGAFQGLFRASGRARPQVFDSVSDLWFRGIDENGLAATAKVKIRGVVSAYAPLWPAHPLARPSRQIDFWLKNRAPVSTSFTIGNFVTWGDGILVPPQTPSGLAVLGMYDKYGLVGMSAMPIILNTSSHKLREAFKTVLQNTPGSMDATVTGTLVSFPLNLVAQFGLRVERNIAISQFPNFALEVESIDLGANNRVLHGTRWICSDDIAFPIYGNLCDQRIGQRAIIELHKQLSSAGTVNGVYHLEPFGLEGPRIPESNLIIVDAFNNL